MEEPEGKLEPLFPRVSEQLHGQELGQPESNPSDGSVGLWLGVGSQVLAPKTVRPDSLKKPDGRSELRSRVY